VPYAEVNDIRMYYKEQGQGEPMVLLHGATGAIAFHTGRLHLNWYLPSH
jgi:hypothetical protein